jgi:hypothetical protein
LMPTEEYEHEAFCDGKSEVVKLFRVLENVWWIWILGVVIS